MIQTPATQPVTVEVDLRVGTNKQRMPAAVSGATVRQETTVANKYRTTCLVLPRSYAPRSESGKPAFTSEE